MSEYTEDGLYEKKLGLIKSTSLGFLSHGILQFYLDLDYGGMGQGVGGICLSHSASADGEKYSSNRYTCYCSLAWVGEVLKVVFGKEGEYEGKTNWEDLKGNYVYALFENGSRGPLGQTAIGIEGVPQKGSKRIGKNLPKRKRRSAHTSRTSHDLHNLPA